MRIELIKSSLRNVKLLAKEYKEALPQDIEDEVNQLKIRISNRLRVDDYERQFLIDCRETKRNFFRQVLFWSVKLFNEIDNSVAISNIEHISQDKFDLVFKELSSEEMDLLGLVWEFAFRIEEPEEPFEKLVSYVTKLVSNVNAL